MLDADQCFGDKTFERKRARSSDVNDISDLKSKKIITEQTRLQ